MSTQAAALAAVMPDRVAGGSPTLTAEALAARFAGRWEVRRGVCEWYVIRRCGRPCPQPEVHGFRHIGRAPTLDGLAVLLAKLDAADRAGPAR